MQSGVSKKSVWQSCVSARHRATMAYLAGKRCSQGSQCQTQAFALIALLIRGQSNIDNELVIDINNESLRLLDGSERWLYGRHQTRALALATLQEALIQAQYDHVMAHEREAMHRVVGRLERLETLLYTGALARCSDTADTEEARCALLVHMGRGMELLQRVASSAIIPPER